MKKGLKIGPAILITLGVGCLGYGGYLLYNQMHAENPKSS